MKGISRSEMNRLLAIPEVQQIIEAKFVELRLIFKHKLKENTVPENNIIPFPLPVKITPGKNSCTTNHDAQDPGNSDTKLPTIIKIIDASSYRYTPEEDQVGIFMDYFRNHSTLRKAILDEFFLRILPYSNLMVK